MRRILCQRDNHLPEKRLIDQLSQVVQGVDLPEDIAEWLKELVQARQEASVRDHEGQMAALSRRQAELRHFLSQLYDDKLARRITAEFWQEKHNSYQTEGAAIASRLASLKNQDGGSLDFALRALEFTKDLHSEYVAKSPPEKRELLKTLLLNCRLDGVTPVPTYRNPFDRIAEGVKTKEWGERRDSNPRPAEPQSAALTN